MLDLNEHFSLYTSYGKTFIPAAGNLDINGKPLKPEQGQNLEFGIKGEFFQGRLNAAAAVFKTKKTNVPEYIGRINGHDYHIARHSRTKGFEAEVSGQIGSN